LHTLVIATLSMALLLVAVALVGHLPQGICGSLAAATQCRKRATSVTLVDPRLTRSHPLATSN